MADTKRSVQREAEELWKGMREDAPEVVAFIFEVYPSGEMLWFRLDNEITTAGEFLVGGEALTEAFQDAMDEVSKLGQTVDRVYLWHSHYKTVEPSIADVHHYPDWLCDAAVVYHAPTRTTTLYNAAGIISDKEELAAALGRELNAWEATAKEGL